MKKWTGQRQKQWKGKSAYQLLKNADVCKMAAGNVEVVSPELPGYVIQLADNYDVIIRDEYGIQMILIVSDRLSSKISLKLGLASYMMAHAN